MRALATRLTMSGVCMLATACTDRHFGSAVGLTDGAGEDASEGDSATSSSFPQFDRPCFDDDRCPEGEACFEDTCVVDGRLRFSLAWDADTDLDLHVRAPDGTELSYLNRRSEIGLLDLDDCAQRRCQRPDGPRIENIAFNESAPTGRYEAWVVNFDGLAAAAFRLEIEASWGQTVHGELPRQSGAKSSTSEVAYVAR